MQVTKEPLDPCQVALTIEVEADKVVHAVDRAYREYAKYVSVPGFRKGKAPMNFVRQRVPESDVRQRAAELLVEPAYNEAIRQEDVQPYAPPKLELLQLDLTDKPFIFKAVVPLAPQVEIGPYTGLEVERNNYILTDDDVDSQIERMRERAADYPQVDRPAEKGDLIIGDVSALVDARPEAAAPRPTMIEIGAVGNIPGFDEQLIGLSVGDTKTFTLPYPEDYPEEDLSGLEAEFTVEVKELRAKVIPSLDDDLAKKISSGSIESLETLKGNIRTDMERNLVENAERQVEIGLIDQIVAASTLKYPPVLVDAEVEDDAKQLLARLEQEKVTLADYLERAGRTQEQLMAELQDAAKKRIEIGLVLGEIAGKENLDITPEDVDAAITALAEQQRTTPIAVRAMLETNNGMDSVRNRAQTKKVLDFLRASAIIKDKEVHSNPADLEAHEETAQEAAPVDETTKEAADTTESSNS